MVKHNRDKSIGNTLRNAGAISEAVLVAMVGALSIEAAQANAGIQKSAGTELAQAKDTDPSKRILAKVKNIKKLMEHIESSHKPQMLYGAMTITARKHILPGTSTNLKLGSGILDPGDTATLFNPIITTWHGEKLVYTYHYDMSATNTLPNRPVDTRGIDMLIAFGPNPKDVPYDDYVRATNALGGLRVFDLNELKRDAYINFWKPTSSGPIKLMATKPYGDGYLSQAENSFKYPAVAQVAQFVEPFEYGRDLYNHKYSAEHYLKEAGFIKTEYKLG